MPLFEYECRKCGHEFEALVIGARKPVCPKCKSDELDKRVSRVGMAGASYGGGSPSGGGCSPRGGG